MFLQLPLFSSDCATAKFTRICIDSIPEKKLKDVTGIYNDFITES